jgi:hypothetical protein
LGSRANFARRLRLVTMYLEATKSISLYRLSHHRVNPPGIASRVDPGKADETRTMGSDQTG